MELDKQTEKILTVVAPKWMKKLNKAKWDLSRLEYEDRRTLTCNPASCFVGEIYCFTEAYLSNGAKPCQKCIRFCNTIPDIMSSDFTDAYKQSNMKEVADHLMSEHKDIIINKALGVD